MDNSKISKIIKSLSVKTIENGCSEEEALAASTKMQSLLNKYNLSLTEIEFNESDFETLTIDTGKSKRDHMFKLVNSIGVFTDCKSYYETCRGKSIKIKFFGEKTSTETANFIFDILKNAIINESIKYKNSSVYENYKNIGYTSRTILNSFRLGMSIRLAQRLIEMKEVQKQTQESGIQLYNRMNIVNEKFLSKDIKLGVNKYVPSICSSVYNQGKDAANNVNINKGVKSSTYNQTQLS